MAAREQPDGRSTAWIARLGFLLAALTLYGCALPPVPAGRAGLGKIDAIVVIYAGNPSFDHLYGLFPGAHGMPGATPPQYRQFDPDGKPRGHLPPCWSAHGKPVSRLPTA